MRHYCGGSFINRELSGKINDNDTYSFFYNMDSKFKQILRMKRITIAILLLSGISAFAQEGASTAPAPAKKSKPTKTSLQTLLLENDKLKSEVANLDSKLLNAEKSIDELKNQIQAGAQTLYSENGKLKSEIANLDSKLLNAEKSIDELKNQIQDGAQTLYSENGKLKSEIASMDSKLLNAKKSIDELKNQIQANRSAIEQTGQEFGSKIYAAEKNTGKKISAVDESLSKNSLYGITGVFSAILLSGLLYWLLSKKQKSDKTDMIDQLSQTKSSIEESLVKEFGKQTNSIESQLQLIEQQKQTAQAAPSRELDHSLALKVASEINLIERNINLMDKGTKGLKQLERSVGKLKDNLAANGYEMPELLGKQYHQGLKVIVASSIPDENLEKGAEVITKILIPQVNYNDKMIQTAQIEVSVGA